MAVGRGEEGRGCGDAGGVDLFRPVELVGAIAMNPRLTPWDMKR